MGIRAQFGDIFVQSLGQPGGRRDGIPGGILQTAEQSSQGPGGVSIDQDIVPGLLQCLQFIIARIDQVLPGPIKSAFHYYQVWFNRALAVIKVVLQGRFNFFQVDADQPGQNTHVNHVGEVDVQVCGGLGRFQERLNRHGDFFNPGRQLVERDIFVDQNQPSLNHFFQIRSNRFRIHRHKYLASLLTALVSGCIYPQVVPGRQALNVRGKDIARADRNTHFGDCPQDGVVRRGAAGTIDRAESDAEIINLHAEFLTFSQLI